jgi:hypothetical protein
MVMGGGGSRARVALLGLLMVALSTVCDGAVYWRDQRTGLSTAQKGNTAVNGTTYYVTPGQGRFFRPTTRPQHQLYSARRTFGVQVRIAVRDSARGG